jgi:hypothetical protein
MYCILPMYEFGNTFYSPSYTSMILLRCIQFTQRQRYCGSTLQMSFFYFYTPGACSYLVLSQQYMDQKLWLNALNICKLNKRELNET